MKNLWFCIFPFIFFYSGNDVIHQLTKGRNSSLYVSITSTNKTISHTVYGQFSVSSEEQNYSLHIADYKNGSLGTVISFFQIEIWFFSLLHSWQKHDQTLAKSLVLFVFGFGCFGVFFEGETCYYFSLSEILFYIIQCLHF